MKHREAAGTNRYRILAKEFVRDNIDIEILEELLSLGGLGIQYCIKSELAYSKLEEIDAELMSVNYNEFNDKYNQRDVVARKICVSLLTQMQIK